MSQRTAVSRWLQHESGVERVVNLPPPHIVHFYNEGSFPSRGDTFIRGESSTEGPFQDYFLVHLWKTGQEQLIDMSYPEN